jgi:hypothetical protein
MRVMGPDKDTGAAAISRGVASAGAGVAEEIATARDTVGVAPFAPPERAAPVDPWAAAAGDWTELAITVRVGSLGAQGSKAGAASGSGGSAGARAVGAMPRSAANRRRDAGAAASPDSPAWRLKVGRSATAGSPLRARSTKGKPAAARFRSARRGRPRVGISASGGRSMWRRASVQPARPEAGTRAPRGSPEWARLTPPSGSWPAAAVKDTSIPAATAQGATAAPTHRKPVRRRRIARSRSPGVAARLHPSVIGRQG